MKMKRLGFIFVVLIGIVSASEKDFIDVPCSEYKKGATWKTHMESQFMNSDTTTTVVSIGGGQIALKIEIKQSMNNMVMETSQTSMRYLNRVGDTIYFNREKKEINGAKMQTKNIPAVPICGKVPTSYAYTSISTFERTDSNNQIKNAYTVNTKKLGEKSIKVPAGAFETKVFQNKIKMEILNKENASTLELVNIYYIADKVGEIKVDTMTITHMPSMANMPQELTKTMPKEIKTNMLTELISYK